MHAASRLLLLAAAVLPLLAACGQTGPLYLPEQAPPAERDSPRDAADKDTAQEEAGAGV